MEGQNVSDLSFFNLLGGAFSIFFKRLHVVLAIVLASCAVSLALIYGLWYVMGLNLLVGGIISDLIVSVLIYFVYLILTSFVGVIFTLAMIKTFVTPKGESVGFDVFVYGIKNMLNGFKVMVRAFFYVTFWPLLFLVITLAAFVVLKTVMGIGGGVPAFGEGFAAVAPEMMVEASDVSPVSSLSGFIGSGVGFVLGALGFIAVIIMIYFALVRGLRAMFSLYAYVENGKKGQEAVEYSKHLVLGVWWKVFGKIFLMGLFTILVMLVVAFIGALVTGGDFEFSAGVGRVAFDMPLLSNIFNQFVASMFGAIGVAFASQLFIKLKVFKGM